MTQQRRHDPDGEYVRRWLPELRDVPLDKLAEPWTMSAEEQAARAAKSGATTPSRWSTTRPSGSARWRATARCAAERRARPLRSAPAVPELYVQRDQPPGVPPLS